MTSKQLVKACRKHPTCRVCTYKAICDAYYQQFKCYPFDIVLFRKYPRDAYSDTQIECTNFII